MPVEPLERAEKCWCPRADEWAQLAVHALLSGHRTPHVVIARSVDSLEERRAPVGEDHTERRRWGIAAVDARCANDGRSQRARNVVLHLTWHRGPGWLGLSSPS